MNQLSLHEFRPQKLATHGDTETAGVSLLFGGDLCPIGRYEKKILASEPIFDDTLIELFQKADLTVVNLESPLCANTVPSGYPSGSGLRADPKVAAALKMYGVDVAGLANNHIRDFGDEGVRQTMGALAAAGVSTSGAGMTLGQAHEPWIQTVQRLRIGMLALAERELNVASATRAGSSWFVPHNNVVEIAALRQQVDFVVVYLHAGHEFTTAPSPRMRQACRALVDAGADAVIVHHPHVIQGVERYRNGLIAYSLGNLVFDSAYVSAYKHTDVGYLVKLDIGKHTILDVKIIPYKLRPTFLVSGLNDEEFTTFLSYWPSLCALISDEERFVRAWQENVRFRWDTEYRQIMHNLSKRFCDVNHKDYAIRTGNLFSCPTHVEMIESAMAMLAENLLER